MKVSVIVPTRNESKNIVRLLQRVDAALKCTPGLTDAEIILIDDGSTDGTVALAKNTARSAPLRIIERSVRGLATAVLAGLAASRYGIVGVLDADLSHPPELIPQLLAAIEQADLAVGSRHLPGGAVEDWPWHRKLSSRLATWLCRPLGINISDPLSGFFFMHRRVLAGVNLAPLGYKILLEILVKGRLTTIREVPYVFRNRAHGTSKLGLYESWLYLCHLARLYRYRWFRR